MPSYVVTGANRGLGFEFVRQISSDSKNTVVGLVRDKASAEKKFASELGGRSNIHLFESDVTNYESLKAAASETAKITGGSLDYLIANAGLISTLDPFDGIGTLAQNDPKTFEDDMLNLTKINVIGQIHLFALFLPLILKGTAKKVIALASGHADLDLVNQYEIENASLYSISKAGLNMTIAKFNAQYKKDGVLFLALSPGMVDTGGYTSMTPEQQQKLQPMIGKFMTYAPHFKGPISSEDSIKAMIEVYEKATPENDGGAFLSHHGDRMWL